MRMGTAAVLLFVVQVHPASAEEWSRFRGPGGSGVLESVEPAGRVRNRPERPVEGRASVGTLFPDRRPTAGCS